jgi:hypothetical protein
MPEARDDIPPDKVEYLAKIGCTVQEIADLYGCAKSTISTRFRTELAKGRADMKRRLRDIQWGIAEKGNAVMAIWLGKNMLNQSDFGSAEGDEEEAPFKE